MKLKPNSRDEFIMLKPYVDFRHPDDIAKERGRKEGDAIAEKALDYLFDECTWKNNIFTVSLHTDKPKYVSGDGYAKS